MADFTELNAMIAKLRAIPNVLEQALPECGRTCVDIIHENVTAQRGPDGQPWQASKSGKELLVNAAAAVTSKVIGNVLLLRLSGPEARHHLGIAKGRIKREILPTKRAPQAMTEAIKRVLTRSWLASMVAQAKRAFR